MIESYGMSTAGVSIVHEYTKAVRPPRAVYLDWPFGHSLGRPFNRPQQMTILLELLIAVYTIEKPGEIINLPYKWDIDDYRALMLERMEVLRELKPD